jgi:hypothetical protein
VALQYREKVEHILVGNKLQFVKTKQSNTINSKAVEDEDHCESKQNLVSVILSGI